MDRAPQAPNAGTAPATPAVPGTRDEDARRWPLLETAQSSLLGLTVAALGLAPRAVPMLLCTCAALTLIQACTGRHPPSELARQIVRPLPICFALALMGLALLSVLWSSDKGQAFQSVMQASIIVLAVGILTGVLPRQLAALSPARRTRFVRALPIGGGVALAFILFELASGTALSLAAIGYFPALMDNNAKDLVRQGDKIVGFAPFYLDRNVVALALATPAVALAALAWLRPVLARWVVPGVIVAVVIAILLSYSDAARLAAVCGAVAAMAVARRPEAIFRAMRLLLVAGVVLALPISHLPSSLGLEHASWLPPSARERAMIWDRTATAVRSAPIVGIGVQSTRYQPSPTRARIEGVRGARRELGWHAHNFVLQVWLELGAVGALLLMGLGLALLRSIARLDPAMQPAAAATFAMTVAVAVTGWGLWQPWLLSSMGTAIAGLVVAQAGNSGGGSRPVSDLDPD